jgi:dephospho-CoA kinase
MIDLIAVCGMPGCGKSSLCEYAESRWMIPAYKIEQLLIDECQKRGVELCRENKRRLGKALGFHDTNQSTKFIEASYKYMRAKYAKPKLVIFDSIRSIEELTYLRLQEEVVLVGVCLDKEERYKRLQERSGMTKEEIQRRDLLELGLRNDYQKKFNVGYLLGVSDYHIVTPTNKLLEKPYHDKLDLIFGQIVQSQF